MADLFRLVPTSGNVVIDSLVGGGAWNSETLTYGFKPRDIDNNGINDFDEGDWKEFYGEIFDQISTFTELNFTEAPATEANLVQRLDVGGGGESGGPGPGVTTIETAVGIDPTSVKAAADVVRLGTYSEVWFHEIGHSLGLKHTHDTDPGKPLPGVLDPDDKGTGNLNSQIYSVMGYTYAFWGEDNPFTPEIDVNAALNAQPGSFGAIDIAALQHIYGVRAHNTGDTLYRFSDDVDANRGYTTIWDTGGRDTIVYDGASRAKLDLRAATLKVEIGGGGWLSTSEAFTGGFTIAAGVVIENARGGSGDDILIGNAFANRLDGGAGADQLSGGAGDDTYLVENAGDRVIEAAGDGHDTVVSSISYSLSAGQAIEALRLLASTGSAALDLTGNEFAQSLTGNDGANVLDGGGGADTMSGRGGDDTYRVDDAGDRVIEVAGGGTDTVLAAVSYALAAGQAIEALRASDPTGTSAIDLTGNAYAQSLTGNDGANVLDGAWGRDVLTGRGGADSFVFANALGANNVDRITDFSAEDTIRLSKSIFTALAPGALDGDAFKNVSTGTVDADDHILYRQATGELLYDADGAGGRAAVTFAVLDNKAPLTAADFLVV